MSLPEAEAALEPHSIAALWGFFAGRGLRICAPASVLAVLQGAGAAGPHFILQSSFISRDLTWGFKTLSN